LWPSFTSSLAVRSPCKRMPGDAAQAQAMAERTSRELGPIGILVNNAAVMAKGDLADFDYT